MFAVPGWSVSSNALKTQRPENKPVTKESAGPEDRKVGATNTGTKKRKRSNGKAKQSDVNSANLAELWDTVIEKHDTAEVTAAGKKRASKRQRATAGDNGDIQPASVINVNSPKEQTASADNRLLNKEIRSVSKQDKRAKKAQPKQERSAPGVVLEVDSKLIKSTQNAGALAQLTPLQASMRQKLISARFRHLNQTLYTTPSAHSLELFQQNPEMFHEYHEGFRRQVEVWPENPVDGYIQQIGLRGAQRSVGKKAGSGDSSITPTQLIPLPRTEGVCYIADLGCGDAGLSKGLEKEKKKFKVEVFSYDLQSSSPLVTRADIRNLPLADGSVDVAIFCLALMGTNWVDFVEEAFRILRWKGELWVAEIKSRFGRVGSKGKRVEHSVGNRRKPDKKTLKKQEDEMDDADLLVAVDGHDDNKQETDVSAFVEVLRKRGFVLQNENAVDLSNRMFVKMNFVKGLTPLKGQHVPLPKGMAEMGMDTWKKKPKSKFVEEDETPISSEASVLKPCVYKLR